MNCSAYCEMLDKGPNSGQAHRSPRRTPSNRPPTEFLECPPWSNASSWPVNAQAAAAANLSPAPSPLDGWARPRRSGGCSDRDDDRELPVRCSVDWLSPRNRRALPRRPGLARTSVQRYSAAQQGTAFRAVCPRCDRCPHYVETICAQRADPSGSESLRSALG